MNTSMTQWNQSYSVGVPQFDQQHRRLFSFVDDLRQAMKAGRGKDSMGKTLKELVGYTELHFRAEEDAMLKANYAAFSSHKMEHDKFRAKVSAFEKDFQAGIAGITVEVMDFLCDWLVNHIMKTDKQYAPSLKGLQ